MASSVTYTPQAGDTLVPGAAGVTELGSAVGGFIAGCGWASLAAVRKVVSPGSDASPTGVSGLIDQAVQQHQTVGKYAASGQSTPSNIKYIASKNGVTLMDITQQQAIQVAGVDPVEVGVSNARAFGGNDSNVSGHYVTILGKAASGNLIVSDPNSTQSESGRLVEYTQAQLSAAQPFWFGTVEASGAGTGSTGAVPQSAGLTLPGFAAPLWSPADVLGGVGNAIGDATGIPQAIGNAVSTVVTAFTNALKRVATFVFGFALLFIGLFVVFHGERVVRYAGTQGRKAASVAALAA